MYTIHILNSLEDHLLIFSLFFLEDCSLPPRHIFESSFFLFFLHKLKSVVCQNVDSFTRCKICAISTFEHFIFTDHVRGRSRVMFHPKAGRGGGGGILLPKPRRRGRGSGAVIQGIKGRGQRPWLVCLGMLIEDFLVKNIKNSWSYSSLFLIFHKTFLSKLFGNK